ncbi:hypothetical protein JOD43_000034 [Pullulanibacillus pueri]|uniref:DUF4145 domain-containing protein n=1 Tax=Pullulanibacillus pueri TaxID=1437324 RepID=A0A8J2ZRZ6_9BACL|nr:DUF4145 domain-containing protein [Pullulanibacillus pueri]MBM7679875.1 hypothetical protein [Pullulanibacillus pueri]GGH73271.1 hypothetical protein GCM10007096_00340 [Pullulanibacillus pueri]
MTDHHGLFDFVEKFSSELFDIVVQLEEALFKQPQTVLMQARLYTEQLVKVVSKQEGLEEVYPLKHVERIQKLYRQNAIEEDMYIKLEWIRKKGNKAAHDVSSVEFEDGLKAHKYLFDISVWYMQVYVNYDFEAPIYKLPVPSQEANTISTHDLGELIKPFMDQSFKQMDEMRREIQRELEAIKLSKKKTEEKEAKLQKAEESKIQFSLLNYLNEQKLQYIDKRERKGALWVVGGWELNEQLFPLKKHKIYFRYVKKGSRATKYKPAWFLLNKHLDDPSTESSLPTKQERGKEELPIDESVLNENHHVQTILSLEEVTTEYWRSSGQLLVPYSLLDQKVNQINLEGIQRLQKHVGIKTFRDLTDDHLRIVYKATKEDFHYIMQELYWLGCRFTDRLASFQPGPTVKPEHRITVKGSGHEELRSLITPNIAKYLENKGVQRIKDLHDMLATSIQWITKIDIQILVNQINKADFITVSHLVEKKASTGVNQDGDALILSFQGVEIEAKMDLIRTHMNELGITGCDNMLQQLSQMGIHALKDLPKKLDELHEQLQGVGAKTVEKFWNQLMKINSEEPVATQPSHDTEGNKLVYLNETTLAVPTFLETFPLKIDDFPGVEKAVERLIENGIKTLGQLPTSLNELGKLDRIGRTKLLKIVERLQTVINREQQQHHLEQLSPDERLTFELTTFEHWMAKLQEDEAFLKAEKIPQRYLKLLKTRFNSFLKGEHVTLEMLGEGEGLTRERIRQILSKGDQRVATRLKALNDLLRQLLNKKGHLMMASFIDLTSFVHFVLKSALEAIGLTIVSKGTRVLITDLEKEKIDEYETNIKEDIEEAFYLHVITPTELQTYCEEKEEEDGVEASLIKILAAPYIKWLSTEQGILKSVRKHHAVEMVMLQYPNGVEVYKREDELNDKANDLMPGEFTGERDFYAIATRQDMADRIFLWGRGKYIHSTFVTKDEPWIQSVQRIAEEWLKEEEFIHVSKLYEEVKEEAEIRNVPNEYALYTLIRHYPLGSLALNKFPMIQPAGMEKQMNSEYIEQFIRENGGRADLKDMVELFVGKRGWKKFTLEFTLSSKEQFILYQHGKYTLLSNYDHIKLSDMPFVVEAIEEKISQTPFISIGAIFDEHEVILKSLGIETKQILYAILKNRNEIEAKFPRYPYIVSLTHKFDTLSGIRFIEQFILEQEDIVAREEVESWVAEVFGENDRVLDVALVQVPDILYYTKGQFGEYIHRKVIGIDERKETQIHDIVRQRYEAIVLSKQRDYVFLNELYDDSLLPMLGAGVFWSQDLLGDILKKSGEWTTIGSYDEILLPINHNKIVDDISFLEYVIDHHFNGAVKLRDLRSFLADIRYSKEGKLLFSVEEALRTGQAPYVVDGDELILESLNKGVIK